MNAISRSFFMDRVFVRSSGLANETYQDTRALLPQKRHAARRDRIQMA
jgi:hypothetical protein